MTYYGSKELAASFRIVRANTIQVATEIPEASYGFRPAPGTRSVAETLVHIAGALRFPIQIHFAERRTTLEGFPYMELVIAAATEEKTPRTKDEIVAMLTASGEEYAAHLDACTDDFLAQEVTFPPPVMPASKTRFEMLLGTKEHEMHHRAQLMVTERLLGITPHLTRRREEFFAQAKAARAAG